MRYCSLYVSIMTVLSLTCTAIAEIDFTGSYSPSSYAGSATTDWSTGSIIYIGSSGTGTMSISEGYTLTTTNQTTAGMSGTGDGTVNITGSGSSLIGSGSNTSIWIGMEGGTGSLIASSGAQISIGAQYGVGTYGGNGTMLVTGSGTVATSDIVYVGDAGGTGTLTISDGGVLNTRYLTRRRLVRILYSSSELCYHDSI